MTQALTTQSTSICRGYPCICSPTRPHMPGVIPEYGIDVEFVTPAYAGLHE